MTNISEPENRIETNVLLRSLREKVHPCLLLPPALERRAKREVAMQAVPRKKTRPRQAEEFERRKEG